MFSETLSRIVSLTPGAHAGMVMGVDGIAIDQYLDDKAAESELDIETIGMEFSVVAKGVATAVEALGAGNAEELVIKSERMTLVIQLITNEYFAVISLSPGGILGKARHYLRLSLPSMREAIS